MAEEDFEESDVVFTGNNDEFEIGDINCFNFKCSVDLDSDSEELRRLNEFEVNDNNRFNLKCSVDLDLDLDLDSDSEESRRTKRKKVENKKKKKNSNLKKSKSKSKSKAVNVPDQIYSWIRVIEPRLIEFDYEEEEELGDDDDEMIPPHVMVLRRRVAEKMAFSVCSGIGRTLKGRDLSEVRNCVLRMTGFLET